MLDWMLDDWTGCWILDAGKLDAGILHAWTLDAYDSGKCSTKVKGISGWIAFRAG